MDFKLHHFVPDSLDPDAKAQFRGLVAIPPVRMSYPDYVDHIKVLREKIGRLRLEIAQIQELNKQYRLQGRNDAEAHVAHGQRHERLQAIQRELVQLANLGITVQSVEEMKKRHRSRLHLVKQAS